MSKPTIDNDYRTDGEKTAAGIVMLIAGIICLPVLIPLWFLSFCCRLLGAVVIFMLRLPVWCVEGISRCFK